MPCINNNNNNNIGWNSTSPFSYSHETLFWYSLFWSSLTPWEQEFWKFRVTRTITFLKSRNASESTAFWLSLTHSNLELDDRTQFAKNGAPLKKFFKNEVYSLMAVIEQTYLALFSPHLLQALDRLYQCKRLEDYHIIDKEFKLFDWSLTGLQDLEHYCTHDDCAILKKSAARMFELWRGGYN